jgi:hypothetical protein
MLGHEAISDDAFRALAALMVAARGAYAYTDPSVVAALARVGWCTLDGEITSAGEDAFARAELLREPVPEPLFTDHGQAQPASLAA